MKSSSTPAAEPKYVWFADFLRRKIREGELKPGERLPSRAEIHEQHQIAQPTIERAQAILEREGLIVRRGRQGVFVADNPGEGGAAHSQGQSGQGGSARFMTNMIAVVTLHGRQVHPGHHQLGWSDFITQGALSACSEWGKHALMVHPASLTGKQLEDLLQNPPLGFVFSGLTNRGNIEELQWLLLELKRRSQRVVVFGDEPEFAPFDRVDSDHEMGGYLLARHLVERGHRRVLPFFPDADNGLEWLRRRRRGYERALQEAGLELLPVREYPLTDLSRRPEDTPEKFERKARQRAGYLSDYLGRERHCDAILSISDGDIFVLGAACRLLGYEPNKDVDLAGYDNIWRDAVERNFLDIQPVATIDKHNWRLGRDLVHLLMARVGNELPAAPQHWMVEPELVFPIEKYGPWYKMSPEQLSAVSLQGASAQVVKAPP